MPLPISRARPSSLLKVKIRESGRTDAEAVGKLNRCGWFRTPKLLLYHEISPWQQDNEYILSGYRPTSGSIWVSLTSLLYLNNQTINTYSHLTACVVFLFLPLYFYDFVFKPQPNAEIVDIFVISVYTGGVAVCFAFSATSV